jgi:hypothetical protein
MNRLLSWLFPFKKPIFVCVQEDMRAERGTRNVDSPRVPQDAQPTLFTTWRIR